MTDVFCGKRLALGICLIVLVFSMILSPIQAQKPPWCTPGVFAAYNYEAYLPQPGTPVHMDFKWTVSVVVDDPANPGVIFHEDYGSGYATDDVEVLFSDGSWDIYLPPKAFTMAMTEKVDIPGIGIVPAYKITQTVQQVVSGPCYYDRSSGVLLWADLGGDGFYLRMRVKSASPGLVNTEVVVPTATAKQTIMGLDPTMFYVIIIVLAIAVVGAVVALSIRRRPAHPRYAPPPPPPPPA